MNCPLKCTTHLQLFTIRQQYQSKSPAFTRKKGLCMHSQINITCLHLRSTAANMIRMYIQTLQRLIICQKRGKAQAITTSLPKRNICHPQKFTKMILLLIRVKIERDLGTSNQAKNIFHQKEEFKLTQKERRNMIVRATNPLIQSTCHHLIKTLINLMKNLMKRYMYHQ